MHRGRIMLLAVLLTFALTPQASGDVGGGATTPAGWRVQPAGDEIGVPRGATGFQGPLGSALSPDGSQLLSGQ